MGTATSTHTRVSIGKILRGSEILMAYGPAYWRTFAAERTGRLPEGAVEVTPPGAAGAAAAGRTASQKRGRGELGPSAARVGQASETGAEAGTQDQAGGTARRSRRLNGEAATEAAAAPTVQRKRRREVSGGEAEASGGEKRARGHGPTRTGPCSPARAAVDGHGTATPGSEGRAETPRSGPSASGSRAAGKRKADESGAAANTGGAGASDGPTERKEPKPATRDAKPRRRQSCATLRMSSHHLRTFMRSESWSNGQNGGGAGNGSSSGHTTIFTHPT